MINEMIFSVSGNAVLAGWLALFVAAALPEQLPWRMRLVDLGGLWLPLALALTYMIGLLVVEQSAGRGNLFSLNGISLRFADPDRLFLLYLEVLTFSLLVGRWIILDAYQSGWPRWLLLFVLPLQLMLGPVGLLAYFLAQGGSRLLGRSRTRGRDETAGGVDAFRT
jgi:hypothetical protein